MRPRTAPGILALLCAAACVDGHDPVGLDLSPTVGFSVRPDFSVAPSAAEVARLSRARVRAYDLATREILGSVEQEIDPDASEWFFDLTVRIPTVSTHQVVVTVELSSDIVEWSGQAPPVPVAVGVEPIEMKLVSLLRGPLDNLGVSRVEILGAPESLAEGERGRLEGALAGGGTEARIFYRSLTPDVLSVGREGEYRGLAPGDGIVEARAGSVADTVLVEVIAQPLDQEDAQAIGNGVDDSVERLAPSLQDGPGAQAIVAGLQGVDEAVRSGRRARIQDALAAARQALANYGTPELRYQDGPELSLIGLVLDYTERVILAGFSAVSGTASNGGRP